MNKKYLLLAGTALSAMVSATSAHAADTATVTDTSSNNVEVYTKDGADTTFATQTDVSTALGIIGANYATKGSVTDITKDGGTIDNKISAALSNYVEKDGVKQLSTNDFTNDYKNQLDGLSTTLSNYVEKDGVKQLSTNDFTNAYKNQLDGMSTTLSNYVEKDGVKQLSTNDFTNDYKNQLDGLSTTLSNYVQKDGSKVLSTNDFTDAYKDAIDGLGTTYATKTEVNNVDAKFANYTTTAKLQDASTDINAKSLKVNNKDVLTTDSTITHDKVSDWDTAVAAVKVNNATHADKADEANTLTGLTASIAELNVLKGMTASTDELNYVDGVTSNIQDQFTAITEDGGTIDTKVGAAIDTAIKVNADNTITLANSTSNGTVYTKGAVDTMLTDGSVDIKGKTLESLGDVKAGGKITAASAEITGGVSVDSLSANGNISSTTGNIVASAGNIVASAGNITATSGTISGNAVTSTTTVVAGTGVTATTGNIVASAGDVTADNGKVSGKTLQNAAESFKVLADGTTTVGNSTTYVKMNPDGSLETTAGATVGNGLKVSAGGADITGDSKVTGKFEATSDTKVGGKLEVTGDTTLADVTANDVSANSLETTAGVTVGDTLKVSAGGADITGNSTVKGTFGAGTTGAEFTVNGDGDVNANSVTTVAGVTVGNGLTVSAGGASITGDSTVTGKLKVTDDLKVGNDKFKVTAETGRVSAAAGQFIVKETGAVSAAAGKFEIKDGGLVSAAGGYFLIQDKGAFGLDNKTFTVDKDGNTKAASLTFNGTNKVNAIDTGAAAITDGAGNAETMATTATVGKTVGNFANLTNKAITAKADVTSAVNSLADNVEKATGGTFTNGNWAATVNNKLASKAEYNYVESPDLMNAINQVATNVGTKDQLNSLYNGVANDQTVNQNVAAVNATIGDLTGLHGDLKNLTNGTDTLPTTVVEALNNIDATLGTIHGLSTKLADKYKGNLAEGTTVEQHLTAIDSSIGNRSTYNNAAGSNGYSASAGADVATAVTEIASNIGTAADLGASQNGVSARNTVNANIASLNSALGDVSTLSETHYASKATNVTDAIKSVDAGLYSLDQDVRSLRHHFEGGMASAAALSALQPNARATGNTQLALGTGAYKGHTAMALGGFHWVTDNLFLNAGVAWDNNEATYRMGVTYSW